MICHENGCGEPASFQCPLVGCGRFACKIHTVWYQGGSVWGLHFRGYICASCVHAASKAEEEKKKLYLWCDFCNAETQRVVERCDTCSKGFCEKHGKPVYGDDKRYYCLEHLPRPKPKSDCFIATATFGNAEAPEVVTLRQFRDRTLMGSYVGRAFVRAYYALSPALAGLVSQSGILKHILRLILSRVALCLQRRDLHLKRKSDMSQSSASVHNSPTSRKIRSYTACGIP